MHHQLRLLLLSGAAVVLIVIAAFFSDWFVIHVDSLNDAHIDLRRVRICAPECFVHDISTINGMYPSLAALAFWSAMPLFVVVATQSGARLFSGFGYPILTKIGTGLGAVAFFSAFGAGYLAGPQDAGVAGFQLYTVERGWGPICMVLGALASMLAVRYATIDLVDDSGGEYKPVVIPKLGDSKDGTTRLPVTPLSVNKLPTPVRARAPSQPPDATARAKSPSQAPAVARTASPNDVRLPQAPPVEPRTKTPSQAPLAVDLAARLEGAPIDKADVAIRRPPPEPEPVPEDQIPVAPESGLVIRKRSPSQAPEGNLPLPPDIGMAIRTRPPSVAPPPMMPSVASALGVAAPSEPPPATPEPVVPAPSEPPVATPEPDARPRKTKSGSMPPIKPPPKGSSGRIMTVPPQSAKSSPAIVVPGRINYAVITAELTNTGLQATREDGLSKLVLWTEIVGIVARRLPQHPPFDGVTFVDIVSSAGATMRILPQTEITGHTIVGDHTERARSLVNLLAAQALGAKLDSATKVFATGTTKAAQLRDEQTLATHDSRLA